MIPLLTPFLRGYKEGEQHLSTRIVLASQCVQYEKTADNILLFGLLYGGFGRSCQLFFLNKNNISEPKQSICAMTNNSLHQI